MRRIPVVLVTATALLATLLAVSPVPAAAASGPFIHLVSDYVDGPATRGVVSSDGELYAFQTDQTVVVQNMANVLERWTLPTAPGTRGTLPTMSGDGSLVGYNGDYPGNDVTPSEHQLYVVDRRNPGSPVLRQVTESPNDLPYQRIPDDTEPKLSRDGKTFVAPVNQSVDAPGLDLSVKYADPTEESLAIDGKFAPVVDLDEGKATLRVQNNGPRAVTFPDTGPALQGDPALRITASTCAGVLEEDASCTIDLTDNGGSAATEADATLFLPATTPNGQTAVKLTSRGSAQPAGNACTGSTTLEGALMDPLTAYVGRGPHPQFRLGGIHAGRPGMSAVRLENTGTTAAAPVLTSPSCLLRFVVPADAPDDTCRPDQPIAPQAQCTAFVQYEVADVAPFIGTFRIGAVVYRVSGHAERNSVALWRDASGAGDFGAAGKAQPASVDGPGGEPIDGTEPSVSADGRSVAFSSFSGLGVPDPAPAAQELDQVYVHDTRGGSTELVSRKPDGSLPSTGNQPSISDDGTRVAFTGRGPLPNPYYPQIYVRDRGTDKTVNASSSPEGFDGNSASSQPQLSGDGGTVAYSSSATNLLPQPGASSGRIYARDITPDLAGNRGANDLVSVWADEPRTDGTDEYPSISQHGNAVAFQTDAQLVPPSDHDELVDVYRGMRLTTLTASPNPVDFGRAPVGSTGGPQSVAVRNEGPAAVTLGKPRLDATEFRLAGDQCTGRTVHPGESCSYTLEFTPKYVGARTGQSMSAYDDGGSGSISIDLTGTGTSDARTAGETVPGAAAGDNYHSDPAISDDGRFVASRAENQDSHETGIEVRDMAAGTDTRIDPDGYRSAGSPDISGSGRLVAYDTITDGVRVADRNAPGGTVVHKVTGTPTDLPYQRPPDCAESAQRDCRPSLAGDGLTIALPARLDTDSPNLSATVSESGGTAVPIDGLVDFGRSGGTRTVEITPADQTTYTAPVVEGNGFKLVANNCQGTYERGSNCYVMVETVPANTPCGHSETGMLRIGAETPDGRTAIRLVSTPPCSDGGGDAPAKAAACTPIPQPGYGPAVSTAQTNAGNPLADAGATRVGSTRYTALLVHNGSEDAGQVVLPQPVCGFGLVTPDEVDPDRPKPCTDLGTLAGGASCTAYLAFRPETFGPAVTTLVMSHGNTFDLYRIAGRGFSDVVLQRADPSGAGDFAGAGKPAPRIVSVDSNGQTMDGTRPSVSGDGRYVAFASTDPFGREGSTRQVYRHDVRTGQTILASRLPDDSLDPYGATAPSLSRDGGRIAFQTVGLGGEAGNVPSQVYVRDLPAGKTVLASAARDKPGQRADGWSRDPSLSDDGSTVGFGSEAGDLVEAPGHEGYSVYVRYLAPDFAAAGDRFGERVALTEAGTVPETGTSSTPALSEDGAFTAFDSTSPMVAGDNDGFLDVYVRRRLPQLSVEPAGLDFGSARIGTTTAAQRVTIRNTGMGPAAIGPTMAAAPFTPGELRCAQTLHRGESCQADAAFAPTAPGRADDLLDIPGRQGYLTLPTLAATLTGTGTTAPPVARFSVDPSTVTFPGRKVGQSGPAAALTVRNTGDVPLAITGSLTSPDGDFAADVTGCTSLMPATTCVAQVSFVPRKAGARNGRLVLRADAQGAADPAPAAIGMSGTGLPGPGPTPVAAMRVGPTSLVFGPQILTTASKPQHVAVDNIGTVLLRVAAQPTGADFTVDTSACRVLRPGQRCLLGVRFVPQSLGAQPGALAGLNTGGIVAGLLVGATSGTTTPPFPVSVALRGTTAQPVLTLSPPTARQGQVVTAEGKNFPPGRTVALTWQQGLGAEQATADRTGRFQADLLVFTRDALGPRLLAGTIPGQPRPVSSPPLLVLPPSQTPPEFVTGW